MDIFEKNIKQKLLNIVKAYKNKCDYFDIRLVRSSGTLISFRNREIEDVSLPRSFGGIVRVLIKGGWGICTFEDVLNIDSAIDKAINNSNLVGKRETFLTPNKRVVDKVIVNLKDRGFQKYSLKHKLNLVSKYNKLIWKIGKIITSSRLYYTDSLVEKLFVSSEGSLVEQEKPYVYSIITVISSSNDIIQRYSNHLADNNFDELKDKEDLVIETVKTSEKLAKAEPLKSGIYNVILNNNLSGVFAHEAFGHLSEADNVYENEQLAKVMRFGKRFGSDLVTIVDDPTISGLRGSYEYDDDGVRVSPVTLLDRGVLVSRLHGRETSSKMSERNNGHSRAQGVSEPLIRMGITFIKPGTSKLSDMLKGIKKGLYCVGWQAGNTDHERFTFTAAYAREITDGKLGKILRDIKLTGNLFETLKNVDMVGDDLKFEGGSCGKGGQYVPETSGGPHIRIKNVMVIGGQ